MSSTENQMQKKSMITPEETINMEKGKFEFVNIGKIRIARFTFEPGWTWEKCEKPLFNMETCPLTHQGYIISGKLLVRMVTSGKEIEYGPGDLFYIPPGHHGWVVGSEPVVGLDVSQAAEKQSL